ncbi:hypothetical protein DPMN_106348 [Dreissena polymorpha]|uniref:Uncharacterized protein n=1 Tax=Dreissena polymorpha TaxID=45954 RepID=A0A9D4K4T5_DREPO|nr:hypothetical protein DPMN_106348 [Dreissena polymorpha]
MSVRNWRTSIKGDTADEDRELKTIKDCLVAIRKEQMNQKTILDNIEETQAQLSAKMDAIQDDLKSLKRNEAQALLSEKIDGIQKILKSLEKNGLKHGGGANVVSLQSGNPAHTVPTEPADTRNTTGKKSKRSKRQRICEIKQADLPGEPLFTKEPEEKDIINMLKAFGVDVNDSTIQSVLGRDQSPTFPRR